MTLLIALADDLSGAAEAATLLAGVDEHGDLRTEAAIASSDRITPGQARQGVLVLDADTRHRPPAERRRRASEAAVVAAGLGADLAFCKVDSLLRGGIGDVLLGLLGAGLRPVLAPALPLLGRTTAEGRLLIHGTPLSRTPLLDPESVEANGDVRVALGSLPSTGIGIEVVRSSAAALRSAVLDAVEHGLVPIVDASTDDDLDRLVGATTALPQVVLAGSGGLAAAVGRAADLPARAPASHTVDAPRSEGVLLVVGTRSTAAAAQLAALARSGCTVVELPKELLLAASARGSIEGSDAPALYAVRAALTAGAAAVTIGRDDAVTSDAAHRLADGLGVVAAALGGRPGLALTGGETARAVLSRLGIGGLRAVEVLEAGCVLSRAEDGRPVVTRPGSFGEPDGLVRMARVLLDLSTTRPTPSLRKAGH